jgi:hypothetical protein
MDGEERVRLSLLFGLSFGQLSHEQNGEEKIAHSHYNNGRGYLSP